MRKTHTFFNKNRKHTKIIQNIFLSILVAFLTKICYNIINYKNIGGNRMLSIAIYTNSQETINNLHSIVQDFLIEAKTMAKLSAFSTMESVISAPSHYDVYLLDMDTEIDSLILGTKLIEIDDSSYIICFSTNPNEAYNATKIYANYFLSSPIDKYELITVLTKIRKHVKEDSIIIKTPLGERRVRVHNVNYINIVKRCLCYHLKDGAMFDG